MATEDQNSDTKGAETDNTIDSGDSSIKTTIAALGHVDQLMIALEKRVSENKPRPVHKAAILLTVAVASATGTVFVKDYPKITAFVAAIAILSTIGALAIVAILELGYRRQDSKRRAELRNDIDGALGNLESLTGQASTPRVLNLQIILRRMYDDSIKSGVVTTSTADEVARTARNVLRFAVAIAFCGWLTAVLCVLGIIPKVLHTSGRIHEIWPALVATSGTVLLLIGIATLAYRFAQRSHDRARCHHDDAIRARRIDAAIRLLMMIEVRTGGITAETDAGLRAFAMRLLDSASTRRDADEISALPDSATKIAEKVVEGATDVAKGLTKKNE